MADEGLFTLLNEWLNQRSKAQWANFAAQLILMWSCVSIGLMFHSRSYGSLAEVEAIVGASGDMPKLFERIGMNTRQFVNLNTTVPVPMFFCRNCVDPIISMADVKFAVSGNAKESPCDLLRSHARAKYGVFAVLLNSEWTTYGLSALYGFVSVPSLFFTLRIVLLSNALFGTRVPVMRVWDHRGRLEGILSSDALLASFILMLFMVVLAVTNFLVDASASCVFDIAEVSKHNTFWWIATFLFMCALGSFSRCLYILFNIYSGRHDRFAILTGDGEELRKWLAFIRDNVYRPSASFVIRRPRPN